MVLLTADGEEDISFSLNEADSLSKWFEDIRPWDPRSVARERLVWLNVTGVPVHAWLEGGIF